MFSATAIGLMALLMMGVGGGFLYLLIGKGTHRPQDALEWAGAVLSGLLVICSGLLLVLVGMTSYAGVNKPEDVSEKAENFSFRLVSSDAQRNLETYKGKVVVLNFWATWCAPCREEMPGLSRLQETYESKGLRIVTISDETRQTLQAYEHDPPLKTTSGYLPNPESLPAPFDEMQKGRPVSFLIDRAGNIQGRYVGARSFQFFEKAIAPYL